MNRDEVTAYLEATATSEPPEVAVSRWVNAEAAKFVSPCPPPTAHEAELLALIVEECAEVQQRATKMLRFGVAEIQPGQQLTNAARLSQELGDLMAVLNLAERAGFVNGEAIAAAEKAKCPKLRRFMQTTPTRSVP